MTGNISSNEVIFLNFWLISDRMAPTKLNFWGIFGYSTTFKLSGIVCK